MTSYPEMQFHLDPDVDEYWTSRNIKSWCSKHGIDLNGDYSENALKNHLWIEWGKSKDDFDTPEEYDEFKKTLNRKIFYVLKDLVRYKAKTLTGRIRSNCTFASAANTVLTLSTV